MPTLVHSLSRENRGYLNALNILMTNRACLDRRGSKPQVTNRCSLEFSREVGAF